MLISRLVYSIISLVLLIYIPLLGTAQKKFILSAGSDESIEDETVVIEGIREKHNDFAIFFGIGELIVFTKDGFEKTDLNSVKNLKIDSFSKIRNSYSYRINKDIDNIKTLDIRAERIVIQYLNADFDSDHDNFVNFTVRQSKLTELSFFNDSINKLKFIEDTLPNIWLYKTYLRILEFESCVIGSFFAGGNSPQPDSLSFFELSSDPSDQTTFDLTGFINLKGRRSALSVDAESLSRLKFNYINYDLSFSEYKGNPQLEKSTKQTLYTSLIIMQKKYGFSEGEEKATKEFKEFEYTKDGTIWGSFKNWIDRVWWDYGYNKSLIFRNTLYLLLFFYIINLFIYKKLIHEVYPIKEFYSNDARERKPSFKGVMRDAAYCLFYTGYIFFGFKLDFEILKLKRLRYAAYIVIQSVVGLICLAYLANYIITV